jgi:putative transposase
LPHQRYVHVPGGVYWVSSVGNFGESIFVDDDDRVALGNLVGAVTERRGARVHAFCWLRNQLLLVLQVGSVPVGSVMQPIVSRHARRINQRLGNRGSLFRHPHRVVQLCDVDSILEAIAVVHWSPVRAGLAAEPGAYPWSSDRVYQGLEMFHWVSVEPRLAKLSVEPHKGYLEFMSSRSRWGAPSTPARVTARARDPRTGSAEYEFIAWLRARSLTSIKPVSLDELIEAVARWLKLDPASMSSSANDPVLSLARGLTAWLAAQNQIATLAELAARFHRGRSTIHELRETYRHARPDLFSLSLTDLLAGPSRLSLESIGGHKQTPAAGSLRVMDLPSRRPAKRRSSETSG